MKKLIAILLGMSLVATVGCSQKSVENTEIGSPTDTAKTENNTIPKEKTKVRMMYWNKEDTVQKLLEFLKQELPDIEVEYQFVDMGTYSNILQTQLAAGEGPDIFAGPNESMFRQGLVEDISQFADRYSEAGRSVYSSGGKMYAVPSTSWFEGIFYNKEIFEQNNLKVPTTFEEELALHKQLKDLGIKPQAMGAKSWEPMVKSSMGFVINDYLIKDEGKNFDVEYGKGNTTLNGHWNDSIKEWSKLITEGYITPDMLGIDYDQAMNEFATGKAAMWESGPWAVEGIKQINPDLKFDMFPFYGNEPGGIGYLIGGPGAGFGVNSNSKVKEAALRVIDAISTPEGQRAYWEDNKGGSSYLVGLELPLPEEYNGVSETIKAGNVYAPWNGWDAQGYSVGSVLEDYGKYFQEILMGTKTVDEALEAIDMRTKEIIEANQ